MASGQVEPCSLLARDVQSSRSRLGDHFKRNIFCFEAHRDSLLWYLRVCLPASDTRGGSGSSADPRDGFGQLAAPGPAPRGRLEGQLSPALCAQGRTWRCLCLLSGRQPCSLMPSCMQEQQIPWACLELMQNWSKIKMPREVLEVCDFTE